MGVYGIVVLSFFQAIKQSPYHNKNLKCREQAVDRLVMVQHNIPCTIMPVSSSSSLACHFGGVLDKENGCHKDHKMVTLIFSITEYQHYTYTLWSLCLWIHLNNTYWQYLFYSFKTLHWEFGSKHSKKKSRKCEIKLIENDILLW